MYWWEGPEHNGLPSFHTQHNDLFLWGDGADSFFVSEELGVETPNRWKIAWSYAGDYAPEGTAIGTLSMVRRINVERLAVSGNGAPSPNGPYRIWGSNGSVPTYEAYDEAYFLYRGAGPAFWTLIELLGDPADSWTRDADVLAGQYNPNGANAGNPIVTLAT